MFTCLPVVSSLRLNDGAYILPAKKQVNMVADASLS